MSVIGVSFDGKHCKDSYGMWLTNVEFESPEPQETYVQVPGRDGELDLSEALSGEIHYNNGTITLTFQTTGKVCGKTWTGLRDTLMNDLHGKTTEIVFDDDPDWVYKARCTVSGTPAAGQIYELTVTCNTEPFKTKGSSQLLW